MLTEIERGHPTAQCPGRRSSLKLASCSLKIHSTRTEEGRICIATAFGRAFRGSWFIHPWFRLFYVDTMASAVAAVGSVVPLSALTLQTSAVAAQNAGVRNAVPLRSASIKQSSFTGRSLASNIRSTLTCKSPGHVPIWCKIWFVRSRELQTRRSGVH